MNPVGAHLRQLGHSIIDLYDILRGSAQSCFCTSRWFGAGTIHGDVLAALSEFARTSRYYDIDQLVRGRKSLDPLARWFSVHMQIADNTLSHTRRSRIMQRARSHCETRGLLGWEMGPKRQWDLTIDVTYQLEIARVTRGQCVWVIIKILKPIYQLIQLFSSKVHELEQENGIYSPNVLYMTEFFPFCLTEKTR